MKPVSERISNTVALVAEWYPGHGFVIFLWIQGQLYYTTEMSAKKHAVLDMSKEPLVRLVKALDGPLDQFTPEYIDLYQATAKTELDAHYGKLRVQSYFRFMDGSQVPLESVARKFLQCIPEKELMKLWNKYGDNVLKLPDMADSMLFYKAKLFQVLEKTPSEE